MEVPERRRLFVVMEEVSVAEGDLVHDCVAESWRLEVLAEQVTVDQSVDDDICSG